jgi:hypothetical protein
MPCKFSPRFEKNWFGKFEISNWIGFNVFGDNNKKKVKIKMSSEFSLNKN